jgi:hypothetical protein
LKHWYVYQLVYPITVGLVKFSILTQYYRIFEVKNFRIQVIVVGVFVLIYTIVCIFVNVSALSTPLLRWRIADSVPGFRMPQQTMASMGSYIPRGLQQSSGGILLDSSHNHLH